MLLPLTALLGFAIALLLGCAFAFLPLLLLLLTQGIVLTLLLPAVLVTLALVAVTLTFALQAVAFILQAITFGPGALFVIAVIAVIAIAGLLLIDDATTTGVGVVISAVARVVAAVAVIATATVVCDTGAKHGGGANYDCNAQTGSQKAGT